MPPAPHRTSRFPRHTVLPVFEPSSVSGYEPAARFMEAHVAWLGHVSMSWFVTLTFEETKLRDGRRIGAFARRPLSIANAYRLALEWIRDVEHEALRGRARRRGLPWLLVIEPHRSGSPHAHLLVGGTDHLSRALLQSLWKSGFADARRFDSGRSALPYLVKDLAKGAVFGLSRAVFPSDRPSAP